MGRHAELAVNVRNLQWMIYKKHQGASAHVFTVNLQQPGTCRVS